MKLPAMKSTGSAAKIETVAMRGINYSDQVQDGDMRDSLNRR